MANGSETARRLRCAIYTRKSTEEGLDQEFNSLDAQREACTAYVLSQRHEGWTLLPGTYDDGGFTGGNMERPGLKRLLADVGAGRVDVIVVYKVDRLTRALADFAKIVDVLDGAGASFVSITQAFNTTTSMGRLTLNVLLSFAQFEREVIAERLRDKIAASKAKGMWMGGPVPLGFDVQTRKLVVNDSEAETVRHIMQRYLALRSVRALLDDLRGDGVVTKRQTMRDGRGRGGLPFTRGSLYHLLKNRVYRGEIVHKGRYYPGEHSEIVSAELFDAVQVLLMQNIGERRSGEQCASRSLLTGLIHDAAGRPMSPAHANKAGRRYRYYVSNSATMSDGAAIARLPALPLERAVVDGLLQALSTPVILPSDLGAGQLAQMRTAVGALKDRLTASPTNSVLAALGLQITVHDDSIVASIDRRLLLSALNPQLDWSSVSDRHEIHLSTSLRRRGHELRIRVEPPPHASATDPRLVAAIVRAHKARQKLLTPVAYTSSELREMRRIARLSYLAPDIVASIFEGRQPGSLTSRMLCRIPDLPLAWNVQRELLGFA